MCNSSPHPKAEYPSSSLPHTPGSLSDRCYSDNVLLHTERKVSSTCCCAARHRTPCMLLRRLQRESPEQAMGVPAFDKVLTMLQNLKTQLDAEATADDADYQVLANMM